MFFFPRLKKKNISCRQCLLRPYKNRYFIKKKWRKLFESEILVIDEKFNNYKDFKKFKVLPYVKILIIRSIRNPTLPQLPNCRELYLKDIELTRLPERLPKCRILDISYNHIKIVPTLPSCKILYLNHNKVSFLDVLPQCKILHCEYNAIQKITALPKCERVYANNNHLKSLPTHLPKCVSLMVDCNEIANIPFYPKCRQLCIRHNPIQNILVNNHVQLFFLGKRHLNVYRFSDIKVAVLQILEQYNLYFEKCTKAPSPYQRTKVEITLMKEKRKTLYFLKALIQKVYHNIKIKHIDSHHVEIVKFFLNFPF